MLVGDRARPVFLTSWEMLYRSSPAFSCLVLFVRVGRVPDVVVRLFAQRPPLILPAVFAARAHHIHPDSRVSFDGDRTRYGLQYERVSRAVALFRSASGSNTSVYDAVAHD